MAVSCASASASKPSPLVELDEEGEDELGILMVSADVIAVRVRRMRAAAVIFASLGMFILL